MKILQRIKLYNTLYKIKKAKKLYQKGYSPYVCICMQQAFSSMIHLKERVPEFNPSFFGVNSCYHDGGWWPISDKVSRIQAFNLLINVYENKLKN